MHTRRKITTIIEHTMLREKLSETTLSKEL